MKKIFAMIIAIILLGIAFVWINNKDSGKISNNKTILIASIVEIQPIADLRMGFKETILNSSIKGDVVFVERNAQGDAGLMTQISDEISRTNPDLVYVLGTSFAQIIQKSNPNIILVQGAVTDPIEAGLADSWEGSGRAYAANSDRPPTKDIVRLIKILSPDAKIIGVLFNPSETNSLSVVKDLKKTSIDEGLTVSEFAVGSATDLPIAIAASLQKSDVLFIPPDNLVTSGLQAVIQAANKKGVPVYATTADAAKLGALGAVTTDFKQLGSEAGDIALEILIDKKPPQTIPIQLPKEIKLIVSKSAAERLGVNLDQADIIDIELVE